MRALRSFLFQLAFYGLTLVYMLAFLPTLAFASRKMMWRTAVMSWAHSVCFLLRVIVGTRVEIKGLENIPEGPLLIAAKHQSAWETFALLPYFSDPAFILKRELMRIPLFGWYAGKARMIPIDRASGSSALKDMTRTAIAEVGTGRQILIFPEGTRRPAGAPPNYKFGVAHLYGSLKVPCLPIALNSGLYWPRRALFGQRAGTIRVEILPAIPAGLGHRAFMARLEHDIETASDRLLLQGCAELGETPPPRPGTGPEAPPKSPPESPLSTPVENS